MVEHWPSEPKLPSSSPGDVTGNLCPLTRKSLIWNVIGSGSVDQQSNRLWVFFSIFYLSGVAEKLTCCSDVDYLLVPPAAVSIFSYSIQSPAGIAVSHCELRAQNKKAFSRV